MIIQTVLRNHIKFLNELHEHNDSIGATIRQNTDVARMLAKGFHRLADRDRKTVSKVLLAEVSKQLKIDVTTVTTIVEQLHYTSAIGIVSTTESDVYDLVFNVDLLHMIERLKQRYTEVASIMA
jgi:hypothetical protein